ncbi:aldo/keto reductase (plasmid) [Agrobacterium sp. rho-8.1]|nr:aldo/keto reductase [Agrobacterium sp. rho-8.1]
MTNNTIPSLGLGTYGRTGTEGVDAMLAALEIGYRHLDTAQSYGTEVTVGEAVARSGLKRQDLFITTKVADTQLAKADFLQSVEKSLETLRLDQVDLLLIHWPVKKDLVPFEDYMLALAEAKERGFARLIGVSNFPIALLGRSRDLIGENALATNQVEIHPYLQSPKIVSYARSVGLQLTAYMPLAKGRVLDDPAILNIAERHGVTTSAVVLAFLIAEGHIVIPSSASPQRLKDNRAALDVRLDETDIAQLRRLDRGERMINPEKSPVWDD